MKLLADRKRRETLISLERDYHEIRDDVLRSVRSKLNARHVPYSLDELEEYYNLAWHALYSQLSNGAELDKPGGFLVVFCFRRAVDEARRARPGRRVDVLDIEERGSEHDYVTALDNRRILREFSQGLREKLTARECQVATLCWIEGYSRPEAAQILDLPEARVQKIMDAATPKIAEFAQTIREGGWCEEHESMMRAYALRWFVRGGERHRLAEHHLEDCPSCRRFVRALRGVAALIPPVWIPRHGAGAGSAHWHHLNHKVEAAWHHHIASIGPHVTLAKSSATAGAAAGSGSHAGGGAATGGGFFAGAGTKAGAVVAVIAGGAIVVGASHGDRPTTHHPPPPVKSAQRLVVNSPHRSFAATSIPTTSGSAAAHTKTTARTAHTPRKRPSKPRRIRPAAGSSSTSPNTEFQFEGASAPSTPSSGTSIATRQTAPTAPSSTSGAGQTRRRAPTGSSSTSGGCSEFTFECG